MTITKEDLSLITKVFDKEVKKAVNSITKAKEQADAEQKDYFKDTERLLYNYPTLKQKVENDEQFLFDPEALTSPSAKSKDIVRFSKSGGGHGLDLDQYTQGVKSSMMRTRQEVARIERALETVKDDVYYEIIPMKYWKGLSFEDIAAEFGKDERTCRRNRSRLVNKLKVILFGTDALTS